MLCFTVYDLCLTAVSVLMHVWIYVHITVSL